MKNLPLGISTLSAIRGEDMVYVDKTEMASFIFQFTLLFIFCATSVNCFCGHMKDALMSTQKQLK